jgi:hypothetical protein
MEVLNDSVKDFLENRAQIKGATEENLTKKSRTKMWGRHKGST